MFFTENDYNKIKEWLLKNDRGIKDSQFPLTDNMKLSDELVFLQDAVNKRIPLCAVLNSLVDNIPINSKKFIDDLFAGLVGIPDKERSQNPDYPAASCCDMFYTEGTSQGDWYLPAFGELGYIMPPFNKINEAIDKMRTAYGSSVGVELYNYYYWSSTEYSSYTARGVSTGHGYVRYSGKDYGYYARAWLRVGGQS